MLIPFDILYEGFCNKIRSADKSDHVLQLMRNEKSDLNRITALVQDQPDLVSLLGKNIGSCCESKNEALSKQLMERGVAGASINLISEAIAYCPLPDTFEEKVVQIFHKESLLSILKKVMSAPMKENDVEKPGMMATLFYARGSILFSRHRFLSAFKDFIRAWLLGWKKALEFTYFVSVCCYECGEYDVGKELLQCCAQHLRALPVTNEKKSEWTVNIVKSLKSIEASLKANSKSKSAPVSQLVEPSLQSCRLNNEISHFSELYNTASENLDVASKDTALKYSTEKGRHLVATNNIPSGATIIAESPYAWTISKSNYHRFCMWCLHRIDCGIPCPSCASAMFCDATCRDKAMSSFHGGECRIMKLLDSSQKLGNMALLCFRTVLMTPLSSLLECLANEHASTSEQLQSSSYSSVFAQTPNSDQRQPGDLLKRTVSSLYLMLCLKFTGYFDSSKDVDEMSDESLKLTDVDLKIASLLLRHLQSASCNAYGINYVERKILCEDDEENEKHLKIDEIGGATFPTISTTNHNCNPNAYRINTPGKLCIVKAIREIEKGEEIFDSYGPLYLTEPRTERINKLQTQYQFRCNCLPCKDNWPSFGNLRKLPLRYKCNSCQCELKVDEKSKKKKVKCPYCDHITDMPGLLEEINLKKERFDLAKTSILAEVFEPFDKDMENILCDYIKICQTGYLDPCMATVEGQEVLKLFWNVSIRNI